MATRPRSSQWMLGAFLLALLLFVGWLTFNRPITASLPDGTTFELSYLRVAPTNEVVRGTFLGRAMEGWIPPNGWKVWKFEVKRPQRLTFHNQGRSDLLVAAIKLRPGSPREKSLLLPLPNRPLRFQIIGDDGFGYVEGFTHFESYPDGIFAHIVTPRFPRDSVRLRFRLEERDAETPSGWRELVTMTVANPQRATAEAWPVDQGGRISLGDGLELELGELTISTNASFVEPPWVHRARLPVRFWVGGRVETNWSLRSASIRDALGNHETTHLNPQSGDGWVWHSIERPLGLQVPWRFEAQVARTTNFPETNLFTFEVNYGKPFSTNCAGVRTSLSFSGVDLLSVKLTDRPAHARLSVISAQWRITGAEMVRENGAHDQHHFKLSPPKPGRHEPVNLTGLPATTVPPSGSFVVLGERNAADLPVKFGPHAVKVTVAIHPNYSVQFTIQPRLDSGPPATPPP